MAKYVAMGVQFFDGDDEWAKGNAEWIVNNTESLAAQSALVAPGSAAELHSWFGAFEINDDGSLTLTLGWHLDSAGTVQPGIEEAEEPSDGGGGETDGEYPAWQQPEGAHDAYSEGDRVTHNDDVWESTLDDNVWEPGAFGWEIVTEE